MTAAARRKGHNFERNIARDFRRLGHIEARRNDETRPGALLGVDIEHTHPYRIQCKCTDKFVPLNAINEVPKTEDTVPLLIAHSTQHKQTLVTLQYNHFLQLLTLLRENGLDFHPPILSDF